MKNIISISVTVLMLLSVIVYIMIQPAETTGASNIRAGGSLNPSTARALQYATGVLSEAPPAEWNRTYGGANNDGAGFPFETGDGGYMLVGSTESFGSGLRDVWVIKTNTDGSMQWNKTSGESGFDHAYSAIQTSDGGYAIACGSSSFGDGSYDAWLLKLDALGTVQWSKNFGGPFYDYAGSVVETIEGGYAWGCFLSESDRSSFWLIKTDSGGNTQWNRTYWNPSVSSSCRVIQTADSGYALVGRRHISDPDNDDIWLVKTNSDGIPMWNQTYGGILSEEPAGIVQTADNGYVIFGITYSFGEGGADYWLVKTNANGNIIWTRTYGGPNEDAAMSLVQTMDGEYALVGRTMSFGAGDGDAWLVKTDSGGVPRWNRTFGGPNWDIASAVVQTSDGGYALAGSTVSYGVGAADAWLIKIRAEHDVSVESPVSSKTVVGEDCNTRINVTVKNQGIYSETFNVTIHAQNQTTMSDPGLVGYWSFDEGSGTTAHDRSGNENHGLLIGGASWTDGRIGGALKFDGVDDYVRVEDSASISSPSATGAITVTAWVRPDLGSMDSFRVVASHWSDGTGYGNAWVLEARHWDTSYHSAIAAVDDAHWVDLASNTLVQEGAWQHLAFTWDGAVVTFYFNGSVDATAPYTWGMKDSTRSLQIGRTDRNDFLWKGVIDDVKVYNRTLSAEEIWAECTRIPIETQTVTLESGESANLTFTWNTTGFAKGNYTISASATPVLGETDTLDNTFVDGWVFVSIPGDINGDRKVDLKDVYAVGKAFGTTRQGPNPPGREYTANCDINDDDKIDLKDYYTTCKNFGKSW